MLTFIKTTTLAAALLVGLAFGQAQAAVMDFQSLEENDNIFHSHGTTVIEDGFQVVTGANLGGFISYGTAANLYPGSTALINNEQGREATLSKVGGGAFTLNSIDLAPTIADPSPSTPTPGPDFSLEFRGTKSDLSVVTQTFMIPDVYGLSTYVFSSAFSDLIAVRWTQGSPSHHFDNVTLDQISAVPLPAAFPLFAGALSLLGFFGWRRKRMAAT